MSDVIALTANRKELVQLGGFETIRILRVTLVAGLWLAFGKVSLVNFDGDPQNANVRLRLAGTDVDETTVRIDEEDEADQQAVSVQAGVEVTEGRVPLDITCATQAGGAQLAQLAAIKLDALNPDI